MGYLDFSIKAAPVLGVQLALSWQRIKLPDAELQPAAPLPGVKVQFPTTTPLLRTPVVLVVPLEVPVKLLPCCANVKTLPLMVEVMVKPSVPET